MMYAFHRRYDARSKKIIIVARFFNAFAPNDPMLPIRLTHMQNKGHIFVRVAQASLSH